MGKLGLGGFFQGMGQGLAQGANLALASDRQKRLEEYTRMQFIGDAVTAAGKLKGTPQQKGDFIRQYGTMFGKADQVESIASFYSNLPDTEGQLADKFNSGLQKFSRAILKNDEQGAMTALGDTYAIWTDAKVKGIDLGDFTKAIEILSPDYAKKIQANITEQEDKIALHKKNAEGKSLFMQQQETDLKAKELDIKSKQLDFEQKGFKIQDGVIYDMRDMKGGPKEIGRVNKATSFEGYQTNLLLKGDITEDEYKNRIIDFTAAKTEAQEKAKAKYDTTKANKWEADFDKALRNYLGMDTMFGLGEKHGLAMIRHMSATELRDKYRGKDPYTAAKNALQDADRIGNIDPRTGGERGLLMPRIGGSGSNESRSKRGVLESLHR